MTTRTIVSKVLATVALSLVCVASQAALTFFDSQSSFLAAVSAPGTDTYDDLPQSMLLPSTLDRTAGAYSYTATGVFNGVQSHLFGAGVGTDTWLSLDESAATLVLSAFAASVRGVGGFFFTNSNDGAFLPGQTMTVVAQDTSGSVTRTLSNPTTGTFLGFVATLPLVSLTVAAADVPDTDVWPTLNNLTLAAAAPIPAVPEPSTYALLALGLGAVGFIVWRRR